MKLARIVSIIMLLLQHKKITAARLAEMFEVNIRTIYRDIEAINLAGIPITTTPGAGGGVSIMEEYKVEKGLFTTADITALLTGLGSLPLSGEDVLTTIVKIKGLVPKERARDIEKKTKQIIVDHTPWHGRRIPENSMTAIKTALDDNRLISFDYYDGGGRESSRKVEPYHLVLKDSTWYMAAYCLLRQDARFFRVSRMSEIKLLEETFLPRGYDFKPEDEPPMYTEITIKLLVDESLKGLMADFCGKQNLEPFGSDKVLALFPFLENDYGYGFILSLGDKCECLGPENVRQEITRRAAALLNVYNKAEPAR